MCKHLNIEVLFSGETCGKEPARQRRRLNRWFPSLGGEDPRRREWQPTPVFLPGESHGHRSLAGCSPWGHKRVGHDGSDVASTGGSTVKNPPAIWETCVRYLGWEDPLEEGMSAHSSILAWIIPRTEEPGGLQSMGSQSRTRLSN